ncbi:titin [Monomorium pharaonis]|uniref:titin n=1 Tax=Monomorium pharaonis TaxID=307658 RepID=UPI0017478311|nr:titin [Monomorium pharaonis]
MCTTTQEGIIGQKHPDCQEVKKDADILAEQVGAYVGIRPKAVEKENATIIKEETLAEEKVEAIAESELLPTLTKEEVPIDIELTTAVSTENSYQPPTIQNQEDLKDDTISLTISEMDKSDIEKIKTEETRVEEIAQNAKDIPTDTKIEEREIENEKTDEVLPATKIEENKFVEKVIEKKEISQLDETEMTDIKEMPHMEIIRTNETVEVSSVPEIEKVEKDAEKTMLTMDMNEVKKIIPETVSPTVDIIETEKFKPDKFLTEDIKKESIAVEEKEIKIKEPTPILDVEEKPQLLDEIVKEKIETEEPVKFEPDKFPIADIEKKEIAVEEKITIEKPTPILDVKEKPLLLEETTLEEEKIETKEPVKFEPDKFPFTDSEKEQIAIAVEEKIKIEEPTSILDVEEKPLLLDEIVKEKIEIKKPELIKEKIEPPESDSDIVKEEKIEAADMPSIADIVKKEKIEAAELPPIEDTIKKETIEVEKPLVDAVTEEKIEIIQPMPIKEEIEEKIEAAKEFVPKIEIKKEKDEDEGDTLPEEVTPFIELFEKEEKEEISVEKEKITPTKVPPLKKPALKDEEEVPVEERKPEMVHIELKIPIAEIKSTEMEISAIPFEPRLVAQPYLIIAKIKEKELLPIIPARSSCTECCMVSKCHLS